MSLPFPPLPLVPAKTEEELQHLLRFFTKEDQATGYQLRKALELLQHLRTTSTDPTVGPQVEAHFQGMMITVPECPLAGHRWILSQDTSSMFLGVEVPEGEDAAVNMGHGSVVIRRASGPEGAYLVYAMVGAVVLPPVGYLGAEEAEGSVEAVVWRTASPLSSEPRTFRKGSAPTLLEACAALIQARREILAGQTTVEGVCTP